MDHAPIAHHPETRRLEAAARYHTHLTADDAFGRLTREAAESLGVTAAFISVVEKDRIRVGARHGVETEELPAPTPCGRHYLLPEDVVALIDMSEQPRLASSVFGGEHDDCAMRAFAAAPLRAWDGEVVGSLCVADDRPRGFDEGQRGRLRDLATAVMSRLEMRRTFDVLAGVEQHLRATAPPESEDDWADEAAAAPSARPSS